MSDINRIAFIVTESHHAHILEPVTFGDTTPTFVIRVPPKAFPGVTAGTQARDDLGPMVRCSSRVAPIISIGDDRLHEEEEWERLKAKALRWQYPLDKLLIGRVITVAGSTYEQYMSIYRGKYEGTRTLVALRAVRIHGPFDRDEGLDIHIKEVRSWTRSN